MAHARSFNTMNETDVRETIVRPLIERLGYRHGTDANIITEKTLRYEKAFLGRKNPKKDPPLVGRADYICEVVSFGRWVVEVKAPTESVSQDAVEQAHTYASHPEIAATFFLVTNGRTFQLYETSKLLEPALAWEYEDEDYNWLRLFNLLSPDAFRKRARLTLVDPGMPLGIGLASRLRIIGGTVTYEEHKGNHPFLQADSLNGMALPVVGGYVTRGDDRRIVGHLKMAKVSHVDVWTSRFCDFGAELVRLGSVKCFADLYSHFKFQLLFLAQLSPDDLSRIAEHLQQKTDLFIDRLGSCALAQAIFLVFQNSGCIHIYGKFVPEQSGHMPQCVFGKTWRPVAQPVADQVFVDDCLEAPDALLTNIRDVVKSSLEFAPPLLLRVLCHRL